MCSTDLSYGLKSLDRMPIAYDALTHAEDEPPEEDQFGRMAYLSKCEELRINPASQVQDWMIVCKYVLRRTLSTLQEFVGIQLPTLLMVCR